MKGETRYYSYKKKLKPLDLVLFKGGDFVSDFIRFMEWRFLTEKVSDIYTHVGMVVTREILDYHLLKPGELYVLESTISGPLGQGVKSVENKSFFGVQIRNLDDVVNSYDASKGTKVAFAKLNVVYDVSLVKSIFTPLFEKINHRLYQFEFISLYKSIRCKVTDKNVSCFFLNIKPTTSLENSKFFCSELVAFVLKELFVLPPEIYPQYVVPMNFNYKLSNYPNFPLIYSNPVKISIDKCLHQIKRFHMV